MRKEKGENGKRTQKARMTPKGTEEAQMERTKDRKTKEKKGECTCGGGFGFG
jgi:hypothetical protein